jgi:hypothetical protein
MKTALAVDADPFLAEATTDMHAWLLLERAFCSCEARCECDEEDE